MAAARWVAWVRRFDRFESGGPHVANRDAELRHRRQQRPRVGMLRLGDHRLCRPGLHQPPQVHHRQHVADVAHGRQVVRDEEDRDAELCAQVPHQVQDGALHRDVERRGDLVGDQDFGANRECPRDRHALSLTTGETARELAHHGRRVEVDELEQLGHASRADCAWRAPASPGGFGDRRAHGHPRVERGEWILEDHLHAAVQPRDVSAASAAHRDAVEQHLTTGDRDKPHDRLGEGRLARAGLADKAHDRLLGHRQVNTVNRHECRVAAPEADGQVSCLECGHASASSGTDSSFRPDPSGGVAAFGCQQATR